MSPKPRSQALSEIERPRGYGTSTGRSPALIGTVRADRHVGSIPQERTMQVGTLTNQGPVTAARQMKRGREHHCVTMHNL
jgi:hypothetical protein